MEKQAYSKKAVIMCAVCLTLIAAAAFVSMNEFTRPVFGRNREWQASFFVLAVCLIVSAAVKKPIFVLAAAAASAVGMYFYSPFYGALFFPVALQAALWEAAREKTNGGLIAYGISLLLVPATIPLRVRLWQHLVYNEQSNTEPIGEAWVCLAGLALLSALWILLLVRSLRCPPAAKKKPAKKRGHSGSKQKTWNRLPVVYAVCALHTVLSCVHLVQFFSGESVKTLFLANSLFIGYLLFRREPILCEWRQTVTEKITKKK